MHRMQTSQTKLTWSAIILTIFSIAFARLIPHPPNLTPLMAAAIFSGASLGRKNIWLAVGLPLAALLLSDLFLGFYPYMLFTYAAVAGISFLVGHKYLARKNERARGLQSWMNVGTASLSSSVIFFMVSNFGVWAVNSDALYPQTFQGLTLCFVAAIPFFWTSLVGDLIFSLAIFAAYSLFARASVRSVFTGQAVISANN